MKAHFLHLMCRRMLNMTYDSLYMKAVISCQFMHLVVSCIEIYETKTIFLTQYNRRRITELQRAILL